MPDFSQFKRSDSGSDSPRTLTDITNTHKSLSDHQRILSKPSPVSQRVSDTTPVPYDDEDDDSFLWEIDPDDVDVQVGTTTPPTHNNEASIPRRRFRHRGSVRLFCIRSSLHLLSTLFLVITICPILALPAVFVEYVIFPKDARPDPDPNRDRRLDVVLISLWMSCVWALAVVVHSSVEVIPGLVVRVSVLLAGGCSEKIKSRLESYVGIRQHLKAFMVSSGAVGSFVFAYFLRTDSDGVASLVEMPENKKISGFQIVYRVLLCVLIGCMLLLVQKYALQKIAINFHYSAYNDRIIENEYSLKVLDKLRSSKPRVPPAFPKQQKPIPSYQFAKNINFAAPSDRNGEADASVYSSEKQVDTKDTTRRKTGTNQRDGAAKVAKEIRENLRSMFQMSGIPEENDPHHVSSTREARKLARSLFGNLHDGRRYLMPKDIEPYFQNKNEAIKAFEMFDEDGNGDISAQEMKYKVEKIYKERRDIQQSLRDLSQVVGELDNIMLCAVAVIYTYMLVSVGGGDVTKTLVPLSSMVLAMSFLFGNSAKNLFECIIFLFVSHPYDTGDRIFLDEQNLVVQEIGLLTTTFQRSDGQLVYIPNATLATKFIRNVKRSPAQSEAIDLAIAFSVPEETIHELHSRMREFVASESRDYSPALDMYVTSIENVNKLHLTFWVEYKGNWQIGSRRWARKTKFVMACKQVVMDLGITMDHLPVQRVQYSLANRSF